MSEIEKALRDWAEKQEARDRAREEYIENHRGHARALAAKVTAEGACLRAGDKALQSLPIGVSFPIIVGEYVVSKGEDRPIRVDKATVIGEAKPKADLQGDLIAGFPVGAKFLAHQKFEVVRNYPNGLIDAMSGGFLRTFYPHETGTPILE